MLLVESREQAALRAMSKHVQDTQGRQLPLTHDECYLPQPSLAEPGIACDTSGTVWHAERVRMRSLEMEWNHEEHLHVVDA